MTRLSVHTAEGEGPACVHGQSFDGNSSGDLRPPALLRPVGRQGGFCWPEKAHEKTSRLWPLELGGIAPKFSGIGVVDAQSHWFRTQTAVSWGLG